VKLTQFTRDVLRVRKEFRDLKKAGYEQISWSHHSEPRWNERFVDVKIAGDGKYLFVKKETF